MPVTERPILLTGATGFVGMAVLARLLAAGHEVHCLVRAANDAEADSRLRAVLQRVEAPSTGRAVAVAGDLTAPRLGLGDRHDQVAAGVGSVIHSAASVAFDLPLEEARAINVEGTRRVLDFAGAVPGACGASPTCRRRTLPATARHGLRGRSRHRGASATPTSARSGRPSRSCAPARCRGDRAPEHRRRREHDRLDGVLQRALRAAARVRAGRVPGAARAPALAGRRRSGRLRRRRGRRAATHPEAAGGPTT